MSELTRLSKSRFCAGLQCPKQLWWRVHEPDAPELEAGPELQAIFDPAPGHPGTGSRTAGFGGGFGLKAVLPALVRGLGYEDLDIAAGDTASAALEALLLEGDSLSAHDRSKMRAQLLAYCERDTFGMVKLVERLHELARPSTSHQRRTSARTPGSATPERARAQGAVSVPPRRVARSSGRET